MWAQVHKNMTNQSTASHDFLITKNNWKIFNSFKYFEHTPTERIRKMISVLGELECSPKDIHDCCFIVDRESTKAGLKNPMNMKLDILYNLVLQDRWVYSLLNWPVCKLFTSLNHGRDRYGWLPKWSRIRVTGRLLERCWLWKESEKKVDMLVSAFMMGFLNMVFAKDEPMLLDYETANMCIINQSLFI